MYIVTRNMSFVRVFNKYICTCHFHEGKLTRQTLHSDDQEKNFVLRK
jgi:hypothetical protein